MAKEDIREMVLNITNHQGNAYQNQNKISFHTY